MMTILQRILQGLLFARTMRHLTHRAARKSRQVGLYVLAGFFVLVGLAFLIAAVFMALSETIGAPATAVVMSAFMLLLGFVVSVITYFRYADDDHEDDEPHGGASGVGELGHDIGELAADLQRVAVRNPLLLAGAAAVIGILLGKRR